MCSISSARKKAMGGRKQRPNAHPLLSSDRFNVCRSGATTCDLKADAGRCKREGKKREEGHAQRQTQIEREREREREEARRERTKERAGETVIRSAEENYPAVIYHSPKRRAGPNA